MRLPRTLWIVAVIVGSAAAASAGPMDIGRLPLIYEEQFAGPAWFTAVVRSDGSPADIRVWMPPSSEASVGHVRAFDPAGEHGVGGYFTDFRGHTRLAIDEDAGFGDRVDVDWQPRDAENNSLWRGIGTGFNRFDENTSGDWAFLGFALGDVAGWHVEIRGGPGIEVIATASGTSTFLLRPWDMQGPLKVAAAARAAGTVAGGVALETSLPVEHALYGHIGRMFFDASVPAYALELEGPEGVETCACEIIGRAGGTYTVRMTGASLDAFRGEPPIVMVVDAYIPWTGGRPATG